VDDETFQLANACDLEGDSRPVFRAIRQFSYQAQNLALDLDGLLGLQNGHWVQEQGS
jgi:hypothetical protein